MQTHDHQGIDDHTPDDRGDSVQNVRAKPDPPVELRRAVLRQVDASQEADWHTEQSCQTKQLKSPDDGVGHAPAGFADGFGELSKKSPVNSAYTRFNDMIKDEQQWHEDYKSARAGDCLHESALEFSISMIAAGHEEENAKRLKR